MTREITDEDGVTWFCVQAFAGLGANPEKADAARVNGSRKRFHVVCTPSGGAASVRLQLPGDWKANISDDALRDAILSASEGRHPP